jgi:hypothetical protein
VGINVEETQTAIKNYWVISFSHLRVGRHFDKLTVYFSSAKKRMVRFNVIKNVWDKLAQVSENPLIFDKSK